MRQLVGRKVPVRGEIEETGLHHDVRLARFLDEFPIQLIGTEDDWLIVAADVGPIYVYREFPCEPPRLCGMENRSIPRTRSPRLVRS